MVTASFLTNAMARADAATDWNAKACEILVEVKLAPPPHGNRALAITQTAVYEAMNAITRRYPASALIL